MTKNSLEKRSLIPFDHSFGDLLYPWTDLFAPWSNFLTPLKENTSLNIEVKNDKDNYYIKATVPGFKEDDLTVEVKDNTITVMGQTSQEEKTDDMFSSSNSSFMWSFTIPKDVKIEEISAEHKSGILVVKLPKKEIKKQEIKKIKIKH